MGSDQNQGHCAPPGHLYRVFTPERCLWNEVLYISLLGDVDGRVLTCTIDRPLGGSRFCTGSLRSTA
jgi:hypothetical protein